MWPSDSIVNQSKRGTICLISQRFFRHLYILVTGRLGERRVPKSWGNRREAAAPRLWGGGWRRGRKSRVPIALFKGCTRACYNDVQLIETLRTHLINLIASAPREFCIVGLLALCIHFASPSRQTLVSCHHARQHPHERGQAGNALGDTTSVANMD